MGPEQEQEKEWEIYACAEEKRSGQAWSSVVWRRVGRDEKRREESEEEGDKEEGRRT